MGVVLEETMHEAGQDGGGAGQMRARLEIPGPDTFRSDPVHGLRVSGTVRLAALPGTHRVTGELHLFPEHGKYLMRYDLHVTDHRRHAASRIPHPDNRRPPFSSSMRT